MQLLLSIGSIGGHLKVADLAQSGRFDQHATELADSQCFNVVSNVELKMCGLKVELSCMRTWSKC